MIRPDDDGDDKIVVKKKWSVSLSVFKEYLKEGKKKLLEKCFAHDWENMKPLSFKESTEEEVKE